MKANQPTVGYRATSPEHMETLKAEYKLDGFKNLSTYIKHLVECQRHVRAFGAKDLFLKFKGKQAYLFRKDGSFYKTEPINTEMDFLEYLIRLEESYCFIWSRFLLRPDLLDQLISMTDEEYASLKIEYNQKPKINLEKVGEKNENEATSEVQH